MLLQLRFGVKRAAGVVEVNLAGSVKAAILRGAQLVEQGCFLETGETLDEIRARFFHLMLRLCARFRHGVHFIPSMAAWRTRCCDCFPSLNVVLTIQTGCSLSGVVWDSHSWLSLAVLATLPRTVRSGCPTGDAMSIQFFRSKRAIGFLFVAMLGLVGSGWASPQ